MDNYLDFKGSAMTFTFDIETWFKNANISNAPKVFDDFMFQIHVFFIYDTSF